MQTCVNLGSIILEKKQEKHAVHAIIDYEADMTYRTGRQGINLETRTDMWGRYRQVGLPKRTGR